MPDKDDVIDAEVTSEEEVKEEKKENGFKKLWNKTKQKVSDAALESKIEHMYNLANQEFIIYQRDDVFGGTTVHGVLENDTIVVFGQVEVKSFSVLIDSKTQVAYYTKEKSEATCTSIVDGVEYERPATKITLTSDVTEVKVIKAGKRYFLYKGEE